MTLSPISRNALEMALRHNGFHIECDVEDGWLAADATAAAGRCFLAYSDANRSGVIVATSLAHVARAFLDEGGRAVTDITLPNGSVAAFETALASAHLAVRRLFELSRSLPSAPLDRFQEKLRTLPSTTEVERLIKQRIGQDIFREALMDFWSGRCAITGLDQPELLRASHMKPWADCADDAERLDPHNGLLLAAHWDLAFDAGLVTFENDGTLRLSARLTQPAKSMLISDPLNPPHLTALRSGHLPFLCHHRQFVWNE